MRISTWGSVNARKPRSCHNWLPAGKGYGVASAMGLSWTRPPEVSLRKRMRSSALTNRTFLTVWSFFLPLEHAVCAGGSWGRTMRRSVPSWAQGGDGGSGIRLRNTEPLRQGRQGAGGSIAEGTQYGQQHGQEDVHPLM